MKQTFIRFITPTRVAWVTVEGRDRVEKGQGEGELSEVAQSLVSQGLTLVVAAETVLLTTVKPPSKRLNRNQQAVPYVLEDNLIDEVETLHFALGPYQADEMGVAVVSHQQMASWISALQQVGLTAQAIIPETLMLPLLAKGWFGLQTEDGRLLLRQQPYQGLVLDQEAALPLLPVLLAAMPKDEVEKIQLTLPKGQEIDWPPLELEQDCFYYPGESLLFLAQSYSASQTINLLQGRYSQQAHWQRIWQPWRPVVVLVLLWLVTHLGLLGLERQRLLKQTQALATESQQIYQQTFPNAPPARQPKQRMQRHLDQLQEAAAVTTGQGFSSLLAQVGERFATGQGITLKRLDYKGGQLTLALLIKDFQVLDQLKNQLETTARVTVEIITATPEANQVAARVRIKEVVSP